MTTKPTETAANHPESPVDRDVVVVGGGAGGLSAAVFTARYGLDTLVVARGRSAIHQCAHLENYLGFPGGVTPERFVALGRTQVEGEGGEVVEDRVVRVAPASAAGDGASDPVDAAGGAEPARFRVETEDGLTLGATYVVAASAYDGEFLDAFADDLDRDEETGFLATEAGRTPVDGLYGVGWLTDETVHQAVVNAGHGGRVGVALARDDLRERYWDAVADRYVDWVVEEGRYGGDGWEEHVDEWFESEMLDGVDVDPETARRARDDLAAEFLDRQLSSDEKRRRDRLGQRRLLEALDDEVVRNYAAELDGEDGTVSVNEG
ncbi:FAD-binding protein [Halobium salinum]|uniref:FAD-binding protein n=1 Tax=Halobium salinum TaxID=1364940 RepID=A0ABD5P8H0_9EURY|nr:FAD-binding protein [Halobium salinum]